MEVTDGLQAVEGTYPEAVFSGGGAGLNCVGGVGIGILEIMRKKARDRISGSTFSAPLIYTIS